MSAQKECGGSINDRTGEEKGRCGRKGGSKGGTVLQLEVWPSLPPNEIFGKCNWTHGMKN